MFARHNLAWLTADGWNAAQAFMRAISRSDGDDGDIAASALERWRLAGWPLVVRRSDPEAAPGEACLGLALPPDADGIKRRIALRVPAAGVVSTAPPLALARAIALLAERPPASAVPAAWQAALAALRDDATGLDVRIYGSLALQALTGLPYLRAASDIDLLLQPRSDQQLRAGLALFGRHAAALPLDGEIVFPRGEAVSWKEWAAAQASGARVLVKEHHAVRLVPPELLAATLRAA